MTYMRVNSMVYVYVEKSGKFIVDIYQFSCFDYTVIKKILDRDPNSIIEVYYRKNNSEPLSYLLACSL